MSHKSYLDKSPSSSSSSLSSSSSMGSLYFGTAEGWDCWSWKSLRFFFFFRPKSSYSSSESRRCLYSTTPLSLNPPPRPVLSSTSVNFWALQTLHVDLRAQLTFPHLAHCQSSAVKSPFDFSAAADPISVPCFFCLSIFFSLPHLLQLNRLAKLTLPHLE